MVKKGWPKGAEMTVTGLPFKKKTKFIKKTQKVVKPFSKLRPTKKDKSILKCSAKPPAVFYTIIETKLIEGDDIKKDIVHISGALWYNKNFDIKRTEKYCH